MANRYSLVAILCALLALVVSVPAAAQNKAVEAQARGLAKKAMEEDYLSTEFDKAVDKLNQAISKCGTDKCGAPLRAQLKRNLGVIQVAGLNKKSDGVASFAEAMRIDPAIALDPDLKTKEVEAAWEEAKRQVGGGGAATPKPETGGNTTPVGDFTHTPASEQLVRTPVPIYAEYTGSESLAKVVAKYKGFGMTEWKQVELKPMEKGFGGEIPCLDVQQGDLQYYLQGFDAKNDPVATAGDRNKPYKVPVKRDKIEGEAPHLPGREPAKQCADTGDCPPGFPGCKSGEGGGGESTLKGEGADCEEDTECKSGTCGKSKTCTAVEGEEEGGAPKKRPHFWIGIAGQIDFIVLPSGDDVCLLHASTEPNGGTPVNSSGYYCTTSSGGDFPGRNEADNPVQGKSDKVSGGAAPANIRILLTADYAVTSNILLGLRFGFVANTYPGTQAATFAPIHIEGRFTYVFGKDALAKAGIAGYLFGAAGAAEWDAQVPVTALHKPVNGVTPPPSTVQAWNVGGPGFVSLGGGVRYAFTPRIAGMFGPRFNVAFGGASTLISISPELGLAFGF